MMKKQFAGIPFYVTLIISIVSTSIAAPTDHKLIWKGPNGTSLDKALRSNLESNDFFYIFTGDTQYYYPCTKTNTGCQSSVQCEDPESDQCTENQSAWSNRYQQISMRKLIDRLQSATDQIPKGLVINGDLVQTGYETQLNLFRKQWEILDERFPTYPGLGNHDYFNNIGKCEENVCVDRMLSYFTNFINNKLQKPMDMNSRISAEGQREVSGSLAYSWDQYDKENNESFHFTQQNNHPTHSQEIKTNGSIWKIENSMNWLQNDLKKHSGTPTILNFHDFDTSFSENAKRDYQNLINRSKARILAIFFAHIHEKVGIKDHWCQNGHPVWLIYSGSVPGNNYVLAHLSPNNKSIKSLYTIHVIDETSSAIEPVQLKEECNSTG